MSWSMVSTDDRGDELELALADDDDDDEDDEDDDKLLIADTESTV